MAEGKIVALIPAHNEQDRIGAAIQGLYDQTRQPDHIVVVADNCTDGTEWVARNHGAQVFATQGNVHKKAGGLNQALEAILPSLHDEDFVLVQDADTVLAATFVEVAHHTLAQGPQHRRVGAVGGIFYGEPGGGLLGLLQRMEYHRYAWEIDRNGGKAVVLTGTGTLFKVRVLRQVREARNLGRLGGGDSFYSLASLTEDDEITKAIKTLGYRTMSPKGCEVTTEVMPTLPKLWHQRMRWQRGALENLKDYGLTRVTARYFVQQFMLGLGALAFATYLSFLGLILASGQSLGVSPFWAAVGVIFVVEKVVSVRKAGPGAVFTAMLLLPDALYDLFQHAVYAVSLFDLIRRKEERWAAT